MFIYLCVLFLPTLVEAKPSPPAPGTFLGPHVSNYDIRSFIRGLALHNRYTPLGLYEPALSAKSNLLRSVELLL